MVELRRAVLQAAAAPFPVLVEGESGTGKELVARSVHACGPRRAQPFAAINCAAFSDELLETELFGHARGAFTGAVSTRRGLFEEASGGTLFLDEVGELSPRAQAKLLRVLQDGEIRKVGESVSRHVDVRIVAATNRRLRDEVHAGRFRSDLLYRLEVIRLDVPSEDVDVNVHPTKAEVRLRNERLVYGLVQRSIREALTAQDRATVPQWAGRSPAPTSGVAGGGQSSPPGPVSPMRRGGEGAAAPFGAALAAAAGAVRTEAMAEEEPPLLPDEAAYQDRLQVLGQIAKTYIVAVGGTGLYLIDQHSAHERVLYEQLLREAADPVASGERNRQLLLAPEVVALSPAQHAWLEEHGEVLAELGFGLEPFGGQSWLVRAVPATLAQRSQTGTIAEVIDGALGREYGDGPVADRTRWSVACHGAVKSGDALTAAEMTEIIRQLEACDLGRTCPHGRPTMIHLSQDQLAREFGRH